MGKELSFGGVSDPLLTPAEVVKVLGDSVTEKTLANWRCDEGRGPKFRKLGSRVMYSLSAVRAWMDGTECASTADFTPRQKPQKAPKQRLAPAPPMAADNVIAAFDAHVAEVRKVLLARVEEIALMAAQPKRRGRPLGSKNKMPAKRPAGPKK